MTDHVWLSVIETLDNCHRGYRNADTTGRSADETIAVALNWQGDVVPPDYRISVIRAEREKTRKLGELSLLVNNLVVVGPKLSAILSRFDLGKGGLYPLVVQNSNGEVESEGEYHFWNFANKSTHFRREDSSDVRKSSYGNEKPGEHMYSYPVIPREDSLAFSRECLSGPDVWRERFLMKGTLLSDALVKALRAEKLDKPFELVRCRVM